MKNALPQRFETHTGVCPSRSPLQTPCTSFPEVGLYPFWFWNGEQAEGEVARQLQLMQDAGCKGAVIHSRTGNKIPYLSERWLDLVRAACSEAKRLGLRIWLYDEDGYPSGNAGGMVQKTRPDLRQHYLAFDYSATDPDHPAHAAFDTERFVQLDERRVPPGTPALRFHLRFVDRHIDTFNPEASQRFVQLTHEKYGDALAEYEGETVQAVYTDDESFLCGGIKGFAWSPVVEEVYRERHGESLVSILPLLVENLPGSALARRRYFALVRDLFLENFILPQREWAHKHGMAYTGHLSGDEGPLSRLVQIATAPMPYMLLEDIPAIDDFICDLSDQRYLHRAFNDGSNRAFFAGGKERAPLMVYKYASSIAHQFKDGLLSAEVLTFLSWRVTPAYQDLQMLFELGMGVNLMTPHAFYYTIGGGTKHDCPPSYFFQQPYYGKSGALVHAWTRIAELLRRGAFHADTLLVVPDALCTLMDGSVLDPTFETRHAGERRLEDVERGLAEAVLELHRRHVGFDFGDEGIMAEHAVVENGRLRLGDMVYRHVVLLPGLELLPSTAELLERLQSAGGMVFSVGQLDLTAPDIVVSGGEEILVHVRDHGTFREAYLVNLSGRDLKPRIELEGPCCLYDPVAERIFFSGSTLPDRFVLPAGSACFILPPDFSADRMPFDTSIYAETSESATPVLRNIRPLHDNVLAVKETDLDIAVAEGVSIRAVYAEGLASGTVSVNACAPAWQAIAPHPADPCYMGADASGWFCTGVNRVQRTAGADTLYVAGAFGVQGNALTVPPVLGLGDLAQQGYPFYWGAVEYTFEFEGLWRVVEVAMDGVAEVYVNDIPCGVMSGSPRLLSIASACGEGINAMRIVLRNTACNFVCAEPARFGVYNVDLRR